MLWQLRSGHGAGGMRQIISPKSQVSQQNKAAGTGTARSGGPGGTGEQAGDQYKEITDKSTSLPVRLGESCFLRDQVQKSSKS